MDFRQVAPDIQYWLLRLSEFGSAGKDRVPPTRPRLYPFVTCGFDVKIWFVLGWLRFFPALPEMGVMAVLYTARKAPRKGQSSGSR